VLLANLLAWPLAYGAMRTWLAGFDDRIALSPLYFIGASLLSVAIAVFSPSWPVAARQPCRSQLGAAS
jgi:putative ABC transport system permease protein